MFANFNKFSLGVDLNRNASKAATGAADFSAKIWNAVSGEEELNLAHKHIVKSVNFSSCSKYLATGSNDKKLRIFDLEQHEEPKVMFEGHTSGIKQVLFTPNDRQLISCSDDKTLRFWDSSSGKEIHKFELSGAIGGMELSKDGNTITIAHGQAVSFFNANR